MKLVLSGFAGVGKSSIVEITNKNYPNVFICPESAREVNYTKDFYQLKNDKTNEFFQKSVMDNEIMKLILVHMNNVNHALFDRCIIDNFSFAEIFYGSDRVNFKNFKNFVKETLDRFELTSLYDHILFIHSTDNEDFILNCILNDPFRKETTSNEVKEFIKKSKEWEKIYFDLYAGIDGIANGISTIDHFIDNKKYDLQIKSIIDFAFKN